MNKNEYIASIMLEAADLLKNDKDSKFNNIEETNEYKYIKKSISDMIQCKDENTCHKIYNDAFSKFAKLHGSILDLPESKIKNKLLSKMVKLNKELNNACYKGLGFKNVRRIKVSKRQMLKEAKEEAKKASNNEAIQLLYKQALLSESIDEYNVYANALYELGYVID